MALFGDASCTGGPSLVPGAARGYRNFALYADGTLRGVTYKTAWVPGENHAVCLNARKVPEDEPETLQDYSDALKERVKFIACSGGWGFPMDPDAPPVILKGYAPDPCDGMDADCGCGFYAYHSGEQGYATGGAITCRGIVECSGKVILGVRGMRAQKARLVAALVPDPELLRVKRRTIQRALEDVHAAQRRLAEKYPKWLVSFIRLPQVTWSLAQLATLQRAVLDHPSREELQRYWAVEEIKLKSELKRLPEDLIVACERARERYPNVDFYDTPAEMRDAYPVESLAYLVEGEASPE